MPRERRQRDFACLCTRAAKDSGGSAPWSAGQSVALHTAVSLCAMYYRFDTVCEDRDVPALLGLSAHCERTA